MTAAKRLSIALVLAACALVPSAARASDADALFKEGRALLDAKKYDEACPKLAESQRLDPGAGTLVALALCHEGQGKLATARAELKQAAQLGRKVGRADLAAAADKRAATMEATVPKLTVRVPKGAAERYDLRLDGEELSADRVDAPVEVDPGEHRVEASGAGKIAKSYVVRVGKAARVEIVVDELQDAPVAAAPVAAPPPRRSPVVLGTEPPAEADGNRGGGQRALGVITMVAGAGGLVAGGIFIAKGLSDKSAADRVCSTDPCNVDAQHDDNQRAKDSMNLGVISAAAGTAALAVGALIYMLAPSKSSGTTSARVVPQVSPTRVGFGVSGTF